MTDYTNTPQWAVDLGERHLVRLDDISWWAMRLSLPGSPIADDGIRQVLTLAAEISTTRMIGFGAAVEWILDAASGGLLAVTPQGDA